MLGKMILHTLMAAGLIAGCGSLYAASAADHSADSGYTTSAAPSTTTSTAASAAPIKDNGYLPATATSGRHHDDHRDARHKDDHRSSTTKSRRDHDDDD